MQQPPTATPSVGPFVSWENPAQTFPATETQAAAARESILKSANWFYWIAGLSVVNTAVMLSGSQWSFILGLGFTQVVDVVLLQFGSTGVIAALCIDVCVIGAFALIGTFARRMQLWAFIVGMVLYGLDTLVFLLVGDVLAIGFHAFVIFNLWTGVRALQLAQQNQAE